MNGEKDEFLFLKKLERKEVVFIFFYGMTNCMRANFGDFELTNSKQIIEVR